MRPPDSSRSVTSPRERVSMVSSPWRRRPFAVTSQNVLRSRSSSISMPPRWSARRSGPGSPRKRRAGYCATRGSSLSSPTRRERPWMSVARAGRYPRRCVARSRSVTAAAGSPAVRTRDTWTRTMLGTGWPAARPAWPIPCCCVDITTPWSTRVDSGWSSTEPARGSWIRPASSCRNRRPPSGRHASVRDRYSIAGVGRPARRLRRGRREPALAYSALIAIMGSTRAAWRAGR